jgi:formylglycine-generating enzyme required for sulfatase activity
LNKIVKFSFCLILVTLLFPTANARAQKSLDGEEASPSSQEKKPKKSVGKSLDDTGTSGKSSSGGKDLDDVGKTVSDVRPEIKPKTEALIRIGPAAPERVSPIPHKNNSKDRKDKPTNPPKEIVEIEKDPGPEYPEMVSIAAGTFTMGSTDGQENESPVHEVSLSAFEISKHEITNHQFRIFVKATNYKTFAEEEGAEQSWKTYAVNGRGKYPVVYITYKDAMAYCNWLSGVTKQNYRLPTEAEWEYAARGGTNSQLYPWGDRLEISKANYDYDNTRKAYAEPILDFLKPVGSYEPNKFGLYDVIGNVAEWCFDGYKADFYKESPAKDPICIVEGSAKVVRGSGWMSTENYCGITFRKNQPGAYKSSSLGFRVVQVIN